MSATLGTSRQEALLASGEVAQPSRLRILSPANVRPAPI